tara:strand:- start:1373 stop:1759 length:387 start_codon:yes stop_codon:yes gene_type:complete
MPLKCKKCGGPHLTIKCGKNNNNSNKNSNANKNNNNNKNNYVNKNNNNKEQNKYCVRLSNIPNDLTIKELNELMIEWGHIGKINFNNSNRYKSAFVDFYIKEEAEYFVKALDKTPFDNYIISVELLKK